ncbi:uncharacterized protein LOC141653169 [Silene latifolia]|uniref:uncharacterized protein LOC141653169 n=1 Tax=Silene latifolia TaxID=37657 RepID=UPI003D76B0E9
MVAISLYRGNLHRVPQDSPRRWLMPSPRLSLKDFRRLSLRRISSLPSPSPPPPLEPEIATENPNSPPETIINDVIAGSKVDRIEGDGYGDGDVRAVSLVVNGGFDKGKVELKEDENEKDKEKEENLISTSPQVNGNLDANDEKEKRKKEIEEKLQILTEKKHNLVQALKQILNAEEELKRRSNVQANRPPLPLQVDASNDSGSMTRHATPRAGSDVNVTVDMEVGDDAVNHNPHPRQLLRVNSTSPSAESALRKPPFFQHNAAPYPSRAAMVAAGSPSRFGPSGNQGQSSSMPTVSVSGTNYIASSPSPAASGGTSCFRDARQPSPWS